MVTLTYDLHLLDIIYVHHHTEFGGPKLHSFRDMNFFLVNFGQVTDGRTDRQTESDA